MNLFNESQSYDILNLFQDSYPNYQGNFIELISKWPNNCWFALKDGYFYSFHQDTLSLLGRDASAILNREFTSLFDNLVLSVDYIDEYIVQATKGEPQLFYANFKQDPSDEALTCFEVFLFRYSFFDDEEFLVGGLRPKGELCQSHFSTLPEFEHQINKSLNVGLWSWSQADNHFSSNDYVQQIYSNYISNETDGPFWQKQSDLSLYRLKTQIESALANEQDFEFKFMLPTQTGVKHILEKGHVTKHKGEKMVLGVTQDLTGASQLINKAKQAWMVFEHTNEAILVTDNDGRILDVNPAAERLMGYSKEELKDHTPKIFKSGIQDSEFYKRMWLSLMTNDSWQGEIWNRKKDGTLVPLRQSINAITSENDERFYISIFHDISSAKEQERLLKQQVHTDKLTGLANREKLNFELDQKLSDLNHDKDKKFAVLFLDLDGFKRINDSYGHELGDVALIQAAQRLQAALPKDAILGRQGGDEFVALVEFEQESDLDSVILALLDCFNLPFNVSSLELYLAVSIGVSFAPIHGTKRSELIKNADTAMYIAKESGRNRVQFYRMDLTQKVQRLLSLEHELRNILAEQKAEFFFQPIVDFSKDNAIVAYESLVRWPKTSRVKASVMEMIECAENSGLIHELTNQLIINTKNVMKELEAHQQVVISINISGDDLQQVDFAKQFLNLFSGKEELLPFLQLEITETGLLQDHSHGAAQLNELKKHGIRLAIDDFGVGYSSMTRLHELPIDVVKIDRSFVTHADKSEDKQKMLKAILALAQALELKVVAEGIETRAEHELVKSLGVNFGQGYLYGRPAPELL